MPLISTPRLRQELSRRSGKEHSLLVARATTALSLLVDEVAPQEGKVLVPSVVCPHVPAAVRFARRRVALGDIELQRYTLSSDALADGRGAADVVVSVDTFGHPCSSDVASRARDAGAFVVADMAQSFVNEPRGFSADAVLYSFGYSKAPEIGRGGVICSDDERLLAALAAREEALPSLRADALEELERGYRERYYAQFASVGDGGGGGGIEALLDEFRLMYLHRGAPEESTVLSAIEECSGERERRAGLSAMYHSELQGLGTTLPELPEGCAPWRYTFMLPEAERGRVLEALRAAGVHASRWYPSCHLLFESLVGSEVPNAEEFTRRCVNLWVDASVDTAYVIRSVDVVAHVLRKPRSI